MQNFTLSIKQRLYATIYGIVLILVVLGTITFYNVNKALKYQELLSVTEEISSINLALGNAEKDFLLRKDLKYRDKFIARTAEFQKVLDSSSSAQKLSWVEKNKIRSLLNEYQQIFLSVVDKEIELGLDNTPGVFRQINNETQKIQKLSHRLQEIIVARLNQEINLAITTLFVVGIILAIGVILLLTSVSKRIIRNLKSLSDYIIRLGKGELPDEIMIRIYDEIGIMIESINILTHNLKNTRNFAIEVGKGNLETQVDVFNNKGDLGGSLIEMRNRLYKVAKERERHDFDAHRRTWRNEGIAQIGSVLREDSPTIEEFSAKVLTNLFSYIDINQGGMFIVEEEDTPNAYLELKAAVAYGVENLKSRRMELGENFVGQAVKEKRTIHLRHVPKEYIEVESSVGVLSARSVLIVPLIFQEGIVLGAIEIASQYEIPTHLIEFLERIGKDVANTIAAIKAKQKLMELLSDPRSGRRAFGTERKDYQAAKAGLR